MYKKHFRKRLAVAGLLFVSMLFGGCAGITGTNVEEQQESSTNPPFVMPGESVIEVTPQSTDSTEETAEAQPTETVQISIGSTVAVPTEASSDTPVPPEPTDRVVVLDPGHGGVWVGALDGTYMEKDLALQTAFYCRDYLVGHYENVAVYLTRDTDMEFSYDQKIDLEERVKVANAYNAELLVSLHFNSDPSDSTDGALVCVSKQPWVSAESEALGNSILNQLTQLGLTNRGLLVRDSDEYFDEYGAPLDYYAICRHSASLGIPGIIVEHCFMRNATDVQYYRTDEALQRLGQADAIGIAQYMGLQEKE